MATRKTSKAKSSKKKPASKKVAKPAKAAKKSTPKKAPARAAKKKSAPARKASKKVAKVAKAAEPAARAPVAKTKTKSSSKAPAKTAKAPKTAKTAKAAAPKSAAMYLGRADSMNASISLLLVDGAAAAEAWKGVDPDDFEAIEKTAGTMGRLAGDLDTGKATSFKLGKTSGIGFQLSVGKGIAHVFRAKDRLVIAEGFVDDVENPEFLGWVAGPPSQNATDGGTLDVTSGVLALLLPGGAYEDLPNRLKQTIDEKSAARIGSDSPGLLVKVAPARYRLLVEPETTGAFGQAARALLERA